MTDKEFANYDRMAHWIIVDKQIPWLVLCELLDPYIPVELDRDHGTVTIYCDPKAVDPIRRKLNAWRDEAEESRQEMLRVASRERFAAYMRDLKMNEGPMPRDWRMGLSVLLAI